MRLGAIDAVRLGLESDAQRLKGLGGGSIFSTRKSMIELGWSNSGFSGTPTINATPPQSKNAIVGTLRTVFMPRTSR